mmetsp:Transcript_30100/g.76010  ORF Transcript_30100/g.76010 Transcript_30100/m.76010 type:complete len:116 (+) Transcript_30100:85-432(+)
MFSVVRASRVLGAAVRVAGPAQHLAPSVRGFSVGIKILDDAGKAMENHYWAQEDERLLKKMVEADPTLDSNYCGVAHLVNDDACTTTDKIKLIFMKHGIPPVNKALINDLVELKN